jgi:hypothetical protein
MRTEYIRHTTGSILYAKPSPLATSPWSTGVVSATENGTTGEYAIASLDESTQYTVFVRAGGSPASSDVAIAQIGVLATGGGGGGDATLANQEEILLLLSGGQITSIAPVSSAGTITGPIVVGDDYLAASSRAFDWFVDPGVFDIGQATCFFGGALVSIPTKSTWLVQGTVSAVTVDGQPKWRLRFELTTDDTLELKPELHNWSVELRGPTGPENITKIYGTVNVINSYTKS